MDYFFPLLNSVFNFYIKILGLNNDFCGLVSIQEYKNVSFSQYMLIKQIHLFGLYT